MVAIAIALPRRVRVRVAVPSRVVERRAAARADGARLARLSRLGVDAHDRHRRGAPGDLAGEFDHALRDDLGALLARHDILKRPERRDEVLAVEAEAHQRRAPRRRHRRVARLVLQQGRLAEEIRAEQTVDGSHSPDRSVQVSALRVTRARHPHHGFTFRDDVEVVRLRRPLLHDDLSRHECLLLQGLGDADALLDGQGGEDRD